MKYLFYAVHRDGTIVEQTQEDKPLSGEGSAFSDVRPEHVQAFCLSDADHDWLVDLDSGLFECDGKAIDIKGSDEVLTDRKLIYFRRHQQPASLNLKADERGQWQTDGEVLPMGVELPVKFFMGYSGLDASGKEQTVLLELE